MSLAEHYQAAYSLDPKVARQVLPLLESVRDLPYPWRLAIRTALVQRAAYAGRQSVGEFLLNGLHWLPWPEAVRRLGDSPARREAQAYVVALCDEIEITSEIGALVHFGGPRH